MIVPGILIVDPRDPGWTRSISQSPLCLEWSCSGHCPGGVSCSGEHLMTETGEESLVDTVQSIQSMRRVKQVETLQTVSTHPCTVAPPCMSAETGVLMTGVQMGTRTECCLRLE